SAGRLCRAVPAMGYGAAQSGSEFEARWADFHGREQGHRSVAGRAGKNFVDHAVHRLSEIPRPAFGPGIFFLRTLPDGALQDSVEQPLRRSEFGYPHYAGVARRWSAAK